MKAILFPGQGVQRRGMGEGLFDVFKEYTGLASEVLGYSIEDLCLNDPEKKLDQTRYTQPALYVVNALNYYHGRSKGDFQADYVMGHSLGEYNALLAAGAFDFVTGLKLVKKRGELMGAASGGGMAAVLGLKSAQIEKILGSGGFTDIDFANYNTPTQLVISGPTESITRAVKILEQEKARCVQLNVSAAFHSRYMKGAQNEFKEFIRAFAFEKPEIPVIANSTARPYAGGDIARTLCEQIASPVLWVHSVQYLMGRGVTNYTEVGSTIFTRMVNETVRTGQPLTLEDGKHSSLGTANGRPENSGFADGSKADSGLIGKIEAGMLGSEDFRRDYKLRLSYIAGSMYGAIASKELVTGMGKAGLMSYFGTQKLSLGQIEEAIRDIQSQLTRNEPYGMNLSSPPGDPALERDTVALYLKHGIRFIEASGYLQMTDPLVLYRLQGLKRDEDGRIACENRVLAKVSRLEMAEAFMSPAPERIVDRLLQTGEITGEQARMSRLIPMSHDICVQADSGGFTEGGISSVLMPAMIALKDRMIMQYAYEKAIHVGLAGGIGAPEAAASAFIVGADFILTGSINQCTVESGISDSAKDMLQDIGVHDTDYAPAGDISFEAGAKAQVLKKGVFFPARARKLQLLYSRYPALEELPQEMIHQLENKYFKRPIAEVWRETAAYLADKGRHDDVERAHKDPKHKMMLVFSWYFNYSSRLALEGGEHRLDYQIHTGPALGAFNQWVKGTELENWRNRRVNEIAEKLMAETAAVLNSRYRKFFLGPGLEAKVQEPADV
jgi:trans-AT polyketide synthase/acyltransferase/oxidoreductase domain-containing protein